MTALSGGAESPNSTIGLEAASAVRLSTRELEVLDLASRGETAKEIALHLSLSVETVNTLLARARRKLGATRTTHAVALAIRMGLLGPGI